MFLASKSYQGTDTRKYPLQYSSKLGNHPGRCDVQRNSKEEVVHSGAKEGPEWSGKAS